MRYLSEDLPAAGGTFYPDIEHFEVEEIPLYEASGEGQHLYITVEKRGMTTRDVVRRASDVFGVDEREIGYAGLKDKWAVTHQRISVLGMGLGDARRLADENLQVLGAALHGNKLRVGHLAGNRFRAILRDPGDGAAEHATAILARLAERGLPNYFGAQRFGRDGDNAQRALRVLQKGPKAVGGKWKAKLLLSALQSAIFNAVLDARMDAGTWDTVLHGDVLMKEDSGGRFNSTEPDVDQPRYDAWEVSISGPITGPSMRQPLPDSPSAALEQAAMEALGVTIDDFKRVKKLAPGTRRPLRVPVRDAAATLTDAGLEVRFSLPPGAYATVLLGELTRETAAS